MIKGKMTYTSLNLLLFSVEIKEIYQTISTQMKYFFYWQSYNLIRTGKYQSSLKEWVDCQKSIKIPEQKVV